jgi:hypothetical protein
MFNCLCVYLHKPKTEYMAEQKLIGVYCLTSPDGKCYVGQSTDLKRRHEAFFKTHSIGYNSSLVDARKRYPRELWRHEILCYCSKEELDELEKFWIKELDATNPERGYNKALGGRHSCVGVKHSEESKTRMSEAKFKPVNQYDKCGGFIRRWESVIDAASAIGGNKHISECCLGRRKSAGGYRWEYA